MIKKVVRNRLLSLVVIGAVIAIGAVMTACIFSSPRMLPYDSPSANVPPVNTRWPQYGNTPGGLRYAPLDQINRSNVEDLEVAWVYQAGELDKINSGKQPFNPWQATPILVADTLIACTPSARVIALDPASGKERWSFDPQLSLSPLGHAFVKCRGVSSYTDPQIPETELCHTRVIWGTGDLRVFALDARIGQRCPDFGVAEGTPGEIQLDEGGPLDFPNEIQIHSPPAMVGHIAVFGSTLDDMRRVDAPSGMIRAVDARSGERLWTWDPVPRDDSDPAAATWGRGSNKIVGAGNAWSLLSADPEHNLVFVPTTSPSVDFEGSYRPGENRYTDSLVALNASNGEVVWHFQFVHHDLWDYDVASQPMLFDLTRDGEIVPAVVQLTKQGMIFVFNRLTGEPLFPIEERPVPQETDIEGEWLSPTQPFSSLPSLVKMGIEPEDAWGFTFWDRGKCRELIERYRNDGMYTPPSKQGTIFMPASVGGANWGSGAMVPGTATLIVPSVYMASVVRLIPRDEIDPDDKGSVMSGLRFPMRGSQYVGELSFLTSPWGAPCVEPPWGRLTAVDLIKGEIQWQVPLGSVENLAPIPIPLALGTPMAGGPIATKGGLIFIAATADDKFRAYDIATGKKLWQVKLPAGGQATPMTYAVGGKQYVVLMAGGHPYYQTTKGDHIIAYRLKD